MGEYLSIVQGFRAITGGLPNSQSGVCCSKTWRGMPLCCEQIVHNKGSLEFTGRELELIWEEFRVGGEPMLSHFELKFREYGFKLVRTGRIWRTLPEDSTKMADCLHTGWLADTLESASHPTQPVVGEDGKVYGVVSVLDCVAEEHRAVLHEHAGELQKLWSRAVELVGPKPYYRRVYTDRAVRL